MGVLPEKYNVLKRVKLRMWLNMLDLIKGIVLFFNTNLYIIQYVSN